MSVTKTASGGGEVALGRQITYTLTVANAGPATANGVVLTDQLPAEVRFSSASDEEFCPPPDVDTTVRCSFGTLAPGASISVQIVVDTVAVGTAVDNVATVSANDTTTDRDTANNRAEAVTRIWDVDLSIRKSASEEVAAQGDQVTYTITVSDDGSAPADATGTRVTDVLPAGIEPVLPLDEPCEYSPSTREVSCFLDNVPADESVSFGFAVTVTTSDTTITNTATVAAGVSHVDADTDNNSASASFTVTPTSQRPANDNFANAQALSGTSGSVEGTNRNATAEEGEPDHAGETPTHSVWYALTPPAGSVTIDTFGSNFDTVLAVYTGADVAHLSEVASNDDSPAAPEDESRVTFLATGTKYWIAVDGFAGDAGDIILNWAGTQQQPPPPPANPPKADVSVSVAAPQSPRIGRQLTFTVTVANSGPDTSTGVAVRVKVPDGATLVSLSASRGDGCTGTTCFIGTLEPRGSATVKLVLTTTRTGSLTVSASAEADYDTNATNNSSSTSASVISLTAPPPPPPPSSQPGTFNAIGVGTVTVNGIVVPADQVFLLNSGDVVDVTNGTLTFTGSDGSFLSVSATQFTARKTSSRGGSRATGDVPAQFKVTQPATSGEITTLTLVGGDFTSCAKSRSLSATDKRPVRLLWGSGKGKFKTQARYSAATVRGTVWLTEDRCDASLTTVVEGIVDVFDVSLNKTVAVNPGQSYLALPKRTPAFKPPASKSTRSQIIARIKKNGLIWSGKRFTSRAELEQWLVARGKTWLDFRKHYPVQAAGLEARK